MEEDLARDIVRIVPDQQEGLLLSEDSIQRQRQEVPLNQPVTLQLGEGLPQVVHRLVIQLHHHRIPIEREEVLRQYAHTGSHLQDRQIPTGLKYLSDTLRHRLVVEEVLSEGFLSPYAFCHYTQGGCSLSAVWEEKELT